MSFLDRIRECNAARDDGFRAFVVAGVDVGRVRHAFAERLRDFDAVFRVEPDRVRLAARLDHPGTPVQARSDAVAGAVESLERDGDITGWRSEPYAVKRRWTHPPVLVMERAAVPHFGVRGFGVHLNGYVRDGARTRMWIGRRALDKPVWPGALDQIVAGGQPAGVGLDENLRKECWEEAGLPAALAARARPTGIVSYVLETDKGLRPDLLFCYDLEMPADFEPVARDGEVESFHLLPIEEVAETVRETRRFKFNCSLVVIDFLVRHGLLAPEHPDYEQIVTGLRSSPAWLDGG